MEGFLYEENSRLAEAVRDAFRIARCCMLFLRHAQIVG
jgi:hypothetical protein